MARRLDGARSWGIAIAAALAVVALAPAASALEETVVVAEVAEAPDEVWALLSDLSRWSEIFPSFAGVAVEPLDARSARLRTRSRVGGVTVRYTLAATIDADARRIDCTLDPREPADVARLDTTWRLHETPAGGTRIELRLRSDAGLGLPRFLEHRLTESSTRRSMAALVGALRDRPALRAAG